MNRRTFFATALAPLAGRFVPKAAVASVPPFTFAEIEAAYRMCWQGTYEPDMVIVWPNGLRSAVDA